MFGRALHRRGILQRREPRALRDTGPERAPFDPQAWLEQRQARKPGRR